jgi:DNA modification methylase
MTSTELQSTDRITEKAKKYKLFDQVKIKAPLSVLHYNLRFDFPDNYPAKMPDDFARDMIKLYSHAGDTVWDCFCGSGVVPLQASALSRFALGTDVNPDAIALCKQKIENDVWHNLQIKFDVADARTFDATKANKGKQVDLELFSPPFGKKIAGDKNNYSEEKGDVSNSETMEKYLEALEECFANCYKHLKPNGILILDARDRSFEGTYYDLINFFRNSLLQIGFTLIGRYYYELIPWVQWTSKDKPTGFVKPMPDAVDVLVFRKEPNTTLDSF